MSTAEPSAPRAGRPVWISFAVGAAIVLAAVALFLLLRGSDDEPGATPAASGASGATGQSAPVGATPERLAALSTSLERPIYWVGPSRGRTYELTRTPDGSIYVRYLDAGVDVGDPRPDFLTVGTYPQPDPLKTVTDASKRAGAETERLDDGGMAVANRARPNSWYMAFRDVDQLVEVFSPKAGRARELVRTGRVVPVEG